MPNNPNIEDYVAFVKEEVKEEFPDVFAIFTDGQLTRFETIVSAWSERDRSNRERFESLVQLANMKWNHLHPKA